MLPREAEREIQSALMLFRFDRDWDDLRQEARLAVWQALAPEYPRSLTFTVARRTAIDYLRHRDGRPERPRLVSLSGPSPHSRYTPDEECDWIDLHREASMPDFSPELIDRLWGEECLVWIERHCKPSVGRAVRLHYGEGKTLIQAARVMQLSQSRVRDLVIEGLDRLRGRLGAPMQHVKEQRERARWLRIREKPETRAKVKLYAAAYRERQKAAKG